MEHWSATTIQAFRQTLLAWYDREGRDLPWRRDQDPYHVWVSEVMLQQTQVNTVIPYYQNFMATFPTVDDLAAADQETLLKAWQGLGYYSRARNLQRAAQQVVQDYHGKWPETAAGLADLTGIGPYTSCAIASIAFGEVVPAVDGNAFRVFSRLLMIEDDIAKPQTRQLFKRIIQPIVDPDRPGAFNQAIMDLGSSYMTSKNPDTAHSPVKDFDASFKADRVLDFPVKTKKPRPKLMPYYAIIVQSPAGYLLTQRTTQEMLSGYWTFPLVTQADLQAEDATEPAGLDADIATLEHRWATEYQVPVKLSPVGGQPVSHTYTHQRWQIKLLTATLVETPPLTFYPGKWVLAEQIADLPLPKVQEKIMARYEKQGHPDVFGVN
ncbi:A G-specific adenine glycosylase [Levilactobacillus koreensis JCM 16448]|uniref:Adenine DNA glycosylase n=1 Tax=Levilactobacillus koreensis TaxID=637971 RepID=A0AAC9ER51_9LACO|nr:A/G-specific adenine glycosylase [Levilactobacillus koreensis]AKP65024.1 DNA glycosylase [Levilactobacillus koreensis]KRK86745.1 A G-specific adenine glycosylase [Levilactobacillus koreensis JCM 16448]